MNILLESIMKVEVVRVLILAAASATSGCAVDLRCQDASERIEMHEGTPWKLRLNSERAPSNYELHEMAIPAVENFCSEGKPVSRLFKRRGLIQDTRFHGSLVARQSYILTTEQVLEYRGKSSCRPPEGYSSGSKTRSEVPATARAAIGKYLVDKKIFLSKRALTFESSGESFDLHLVNENLNCHPSGEDQNENWQCREDGTVIEDLPGDQLLQKCRKRVPVKLGIHGANLVGTVDDRFCLSISVVEEKAVRDEGAPRGTNILRDSLEIDMWCHDEPGPIAPGVVVGGPRPNFREPPAPEL